MSAVKGEGVAKTVIPQGVIVAAVPQGITPTVVTKVDAHTVGP